jgi:hypothetical protein
MRHLGLLLLIAAGTTGCADSVISDIQPGNQETVTVVGDSLAYIATDLRNVSDRVTFTWNNPAERLTTIHQSFLPHGYGLLVVRDAVGSVVDSTLLEYQLQTYSFAGVPGLWSVTLIYAAAWGRAQFSLVPLVDGPPPSGREAAPPVARQPSDDRLPGSGGRIGEARANEAYDVRRRR